jgi:hypothetical protein
MADGEPYSGLFGAYRYAFRQSDSLLFRAYVLLSALCGAYVSLLLVLAAVSWLATPGALEEKALLGVIGVLVLAPLFAPVLIVARRYRLGHDRPGMDRAFALVGSAFLLSLVLALVVTDPNAHSGPGPVGDALDFLDALPATYGLAFPVVAVLLIYVAVRYTRPEESNVAE